MTVHREALVLKSNEGAMKENLFLRWEGRGGWWVGKSLKENTQRKETKQI